MLRTIIYLLLLHFLPTGVIAQSQYPSHTAFATSLGVQLGSAGIGVEFNYPIYNNLSIRWQANYLPEVRKHYHGLIYQPQRTLTGVNIDWQPLFGGNSWFARKWFVAFGFYYFLKHQMSTFKESRVIGEPREKYYEVDLGKVRPYLGMGIGRLALTERLFLNLNGGFFIPTAKTKVEMVHKEQYDPSVIDRVEREEQNRYNRVWAHLATSLNIQVGLFYNFAYRFNTYQWQPKEWNNKKKKNYRPSKNQQFR